MRRGIGTDGRVVAVIGDGALTGGVSFEALLNAGGMDLPIVIVVNDNGMSIAPNVGALSRYFNRMRLNPKLYHAREDVEETLTQLPAGIGKRIERLGPILKESLKAYWAPGLFFEELDLAYVGVIDGHDVKALRQAIGEALEADRPVVVHCKTVKGKGFAPAEEGGLEGMEKWHAAKPGSIVERRGRADAGAQAQAEVRRAPAVHDRLRQRARGGVPARRASRRHHRRDELRHGAEHPPARAARALLRRRHRRAARDPVRGRAGAAGREAGGGDLLDLPPARLRPDRPRRLPAGAQRGVRDGPRRAGRRRRPDPPRRLRHLLPALPAQHGADGAARRGDARAHAAHRAELRRRPGRAALPARRGARACRCRARPEAIEIGRGELLREGERVALLGYGYGVAVALGAADLLAAEHGVDAHRGRRPLRQAARRRAGRAAGGRARPDRDGRGERAGRRLRLRACSSTSPTATCSAGRACCGSACPTASSRTASRRCCARRSASPRRPWPSGWPQAVLEPSGALA